MMFLLHRAVDHAFRNLPLSARQTLGFTTLRLRLLGFQTDDPDMVWEGPPASDVTSHFLEIFGGCCPGMFAFDVGGIDSDDEREKLYRSYAKNRGIFGLRVGQK